MAYPPSLLEKIMTPGEVRSVYQPIFRMSEHETEIFALESLTRGPRGTNIESADVFFEYVRRKRKEDVVDLTCLKSAIRNAAALPNFGKLFVNVHASTMAKNQCFVDSLECICSFFSFPPSNLVIEVIEHSPYWDRGEFVLSTRRLREMGVQIAVDDLGVAYSSFKVILDVNPDYLKIDMYITRGCHNDRIRRSMIESFLLLGRDAGAELIAEGMEDAQDLHTLQSMGIPMFQGYLLAKPQPAEQLTKLLENSEDAFRNLGRQFPLPMGDYPTEYIMNS